ncbi:hypothetical protein ACJQWK_09972 [Exserohilum turcicum]|uniref:Zn(2)-C6 fungal-type domain-containing protein n=1 Tax=Exserohilum turcicum (strain 28A) TaxID=671987 RepID=R0I5S9_EXST2|nr:uncharacterized protein SETTUDRAFT_44762 [Exserohilum turcica Et28A]EOA80916.1 hypothetical protein SETTUDRAFT_44762 [Exserohilum turcica Et28A]
MSTSTPAPTTSSRRVPLDKRKRTETSCDKCKSRKQKCRKEPGQDACRYCMVHNIECLTTQPRKKRLYGSVEGLGTRLALLEALVKGLLPDADVSSTDALRQLATSHGIPLPTAAVADAAAHDDAARDAADDDDTVSLLPDQQGQVQYIGPGSSFAFHLKLRTLVGRGPLREFVLFGKNAAASTSPERGDDHQRAFPGTAAANSHGHSHGHSHNINSNSNSNNNNTNHPSIAASASAAAAAASASPVHCHASSPVAAGPAGLPTPLDRPTLEFLIRAYFDHIHPETPVLHEPSFREAFEAWLVNPHNADPAWLCSFNCLVLLARRAVRMPFTEEQERMWWQRVQKLLPGITFMSSITAVQALILAAIHLHNHNHRDACWNLTGTAIRIAHAIGLHQDRVSTGQTPLAREMRSMLWWTLCMVEMMQVSSYDRPSAIETSISKIRCPNEKILGTPPGYLAASTRLLILLGATCRVPRTLKPNDRDDTYVGPLSPAATVLRDLVRWRETLPQHLQLEALDTCPPNFQRNLLMLHCTYHYTIIVLCRSAQLARATSLSKTGQDSTNAALIAMADACSESGRKSAQILLKIDGLGKFNATAGLDVWYMLASSSALVLDLVCLNKLEGTNMSESRILLSQLADLAQRQRRNPFMPGTYQKFASLVPELHSMADSLASPVRFAELKVETQEPGPQTTLPSQQLSQPDAVPHMYHQSPAAATGSYMFADHLQGRIYPEQPFVTPAMHPNARFERTAQMHFMDFTVNNMNDWSWNDMNGLLGTDSLTAMHGDPNVHGQQPSGPN